MSRVTGPVGAAPVSAGSSSRPLLLAAALPQAPRPRFKPALRKLVAADEMPPLAGVMQRNTDQLEPAEHAVADNEIRRPGPLAGNGVDVLGRGGERQED